MKVEALDRLLLLLLLPDASPANVAEGLWILEHHRPADHSVAIHPDDGTISWPAIEGIRHSIKERLGNKLPMDDTLVKVQSHVLGVFGRYHFESKLQDVLENARALLQQYMLDPTTKAQVILSIKSQLDVLTRLMNKRSLVGCYPIDLPGEPVGPDSEAEGDGTGSQHDEATPYASDEDSSGSSNARAESSITPSSIVSTDAEFYDTDILVMQSYDNEEEQASANAAGQDDAPTAAPAAQQTDDIVETADEEDEQSSDEVEEPAIMKFHEIEGESDDARAKRFSAYCASLDYCL
ncbi:unnamed protein product [Urochloa humidicola]